MATFLESLRNRYLALYGEESSDPNAISSLEKALNVSIPKDFTFISTFYRGGMVGGIEHLAIAPDTTSESILTETKRVRSAIELDRSLIILAEPSESVIVLDCSDSVEPASRVIWCDPHQLNQLASATSGIIEPAVDAWRDYASFFEFLLTQEEFERRDE